MPYYELLKEAVEVLRRIAEEPAVVPLGSVGLILHKWHLHNRHCSKCGRGPIGHDAEPALCDDCHHNHDHGGEG